MQTDYVSVGTNWDAGRTIDYLHEEEDLPDEFLDLFVVIVAKPVGVISAFPHFGASASDLYASEICDETQVIVPAEMVQEEVALLKVRPDDGRVVDAQGKLIGMDYVDDAMEVAREEFEEDACFGGGRNGGRWRPAGFGQTLHLVAGEFGHRRSGVHRDRLFDATIEQMVALAVLMPIVASMGGNAGTQTLTITVRGLGDHELTTTTPWRRPSARNFWWVFSTVARLPPWRAVSRFFGLTSSTMRICWAGSLPGPWSSTWPGLLRRCFARPC